jgi:hypothetical protein
LIGDLIDGDPGDDVLRPAVVTSFVIIYLYTTPPAQHAAGDLLFADGGGLAVGIVAWLGYAIDPYSVLVPFLIFAIGVSTRRRR